jgi:hypothetical protein
VNSFINKLEKIMNQKFDNVNEIKNVLNSLKDVKVVLYNKEDNGFSFDIITDFGTYKVHFDFNYHLLKAFQK